MKQVTIGLFINLIIVVLFYFEAQQPTIDAGAYYILFHVSALCWLVSFVGLFLLIQSKTKIGAFLIMAGSAIFIPIGFIALLGGAKFMKSAQAQDLKLRSNSLASAPSAPDLSTTSRESLAFYSRKHFMSLTIILLITIVALFAVDLYFAAAISATYSILIGGLVLHFISAYTPTVTVGKDYIKLGMGLTQKSNLLLSDVRAINRDKKKIVLHVQRRDDRKLWEAPIYLTAMDEETQHQLYRTLQTRLKSPSNQASSATVLSPE
ncbi:hypothetical protein [Aliidiomarina soli]|uniref:DUF5673 domain-containing protein n=1 Tax=Aliidiomarina soli TaxID=1928574 RepID=A0A432WJ76_9GAMM|nr:hypothetical protein [Aliidiomarina soli]RUO33729.1 hypothetical protein CWE14_04495 [Aliidiomarina soli]